MIRLIVAARQANRYHARPPRTSSGSCLADFFALRFKVRAGDFGVTKVYDPETDEFIPVEPNDQVGLVVEAMPMGWSWSLHICTDALEHVVRITGTGCDLARERCEALLRVRRQYQCARHHL